MAKGYFITEKTAPLIRQLARIIKKVDSIRGDGVTNGPDFIHIGQQQTRAPRPIVSGGSECVRMKVRLAADSNGVAICNRWDGTTLGTLDIPVRMSLGKGKVGEELWATKATPNAGVEYDSADVTWLEVVIGETASPTTLGAASEGSESADTTTWSVQADGTPCDIYVISRVGFYHAGDEKLYGYTRKLSIDSKGRIFAISAETRVEIDVPEECP